MEALNVSARLALEAANPSGIHQMKASTTTDDVEQLQIPVASRYSGRPFTHSVSRKPWQPMHSTDF